MSVIPRCELTLNPDFAKRIQWHTDDERVWRDGNGELMATAYCWRDGGPDGDLHSRNLEGEGAAIVLTRAGHTQLDSLLGPSKQDVIARRHKKSDGLSSERIARATRTTIPFTGDR